MKFANFLPETKKLAIDFGGDVLNLEYRPSALLSQVDDADDDTDDDLERNRLAERICDVVVSWDAEGPLPVFATRGKDVGAVVPAGKVIPLEVEHVSYVPVPSLVGILRELMEDATPDPKGTRKQSRRRG